jgi:hypothetical protein
MLKLLYWAIILGAHAHDVRDPSEQFVPPDWQGNPWGPAAVVARAECKLPAIEMSPEMEQWDQWGRTVLQDGDIVFRMGDARIFFGIFRFSRFLADASGSRYSHAAIVAFEGGSLVVYDCAKSGVGRVPFSVWVLDNVGPIGVKRLKRERREAIAGVLDYCRRVFEEQVPFDYEFDLDDSAVYCLELTEKAFRSQRLALSEPIRLGDMQNARRYPLCMGLFLALSPLTLNRPFTLEQRVYMPGNSRHGVWASPLLETVYPPATDREEDDPPVSDGHLSMSGDLAIIAGIVSELRRTVTRTASGPDNVAKPRLSTKGGHLLSARDCGSLRPGEDRAHEWQGQ